MNKSRLSPAVIIGGLAGVGVLLFLAFGVFGVHTLFTDDVVDEANPFDVSVGVSGRPEDATSADLAEQMNNAMADDGTKGNATADDAMPDAMEGDAAVSIVSSGSFEGRAHPAEGTAKIITDGNQTFLRFEEFATDNGPDLNVYLSAAPLDSDSGTYDDDFIDLGDLTGNIGDQNYELDPSIDLSRYPTVVIWCVRFGVAFGAAELAA